MHKKKRILLMYITLNSGHHRASLAIENALKRLSPGIEILNINSVAYTNPIFEKIVNKTYMSIIKRKPEVWEYLYDNPKVLKSVQRLRDNIHKLNTKKLKVLLEDFRPDAVVCTQAFPCGMVADYKKRLGMKLPLFGVLTDHAPHSYWIFDNVDYYIVPCQQSRDKFVREGIDENKIKIFGIPIDPKFSITHDRAELCRKIGLKPDVPAVLMMGGSQGLGPVENIVDVLEKLDINLQLIVVCGINKSLEKKLYKRKHKYKKPLLVLGHVNNIDELMEVSSIIITKPGGLTTAESLSKGLPMIVVHPIPGQETKNTEFLTGAGVALRADDKGDVAAFVKELLLNNHKLSEMRNNATNLKKPNSAIDIADLVMNG